MTLGSILYKGMPMKSPQHNNYSFAICLVTSLFFMWALGSSINGILIKHFRDTMHLSRFEAGFVDTAFYLGYFIMAIPAGIVNRKIGYKGGILVGLILFAVGSFLFYPASGVGTYSFFLLALWIIASGLTFLENCGCSYIARLGDPQFAERRLNLAQSFNGLGLVLTVYFGGHLIFSNPGNVYVVFLIIGSIAAVLALIFLFTKLPPIQDKTDSIKIDFTVITKYPHLRYGVLGIFFYLGAQASIWGYFLYIVNEKVPSMPDVQANNYYSLCFLVFMLGRFFSTFFMRYVKPTKLLAIYAFINIVLLVLTQAFPHMIGVYALIAVNFFMSAMYPTIFSLSIREVGQDTKIAASFLVMAIIGGAIFPPLLGLVADIFGNILYGLVIPILCFAYIGFFAIHGHVIRKIII